MINNRVIVWVWNVSSSHKPMHAMVFGYTPVIEYYHAPLLAGPGVFFKYPAFAVSQSRLFITVLPDVNGVIQ